MGRAAPGKRIVGGKDAEHSGLVEKGELKVHIPVGLGCKELRSVIEGLVVAL